MKYEQISFGHENDKSIKDYEKNASKLAQSYNTFVENLLGKGLISKEDVIQIDAEMENELRDQMSEEEFKSFSESDLALSEKKEVNHDSHKKERINIGPKDYEVKTSSLLSGKLNDQDVEMQREKFEYTPKFGIKDQYKFSGSMDGEKLSPEESKRLFSKYYKFQKDRLNKLENLLKERSYNKEREERAEKYRKQENKFEKTFNS